MIALLLHCCMRVKCGFLLSGPDRIIRASRHYERAGHIITRMGVATAKKFISGTRSEPPPIGQPVTVTAPGGQQIQSVEEENPFCFWQGSSLSNKKHVIRNTLLLDREYFMIEHQFPHVQLESILLEVGLTHLLKPTSGAELWWPWQLRSMMRLASYCITHNVEFARNYLFYRNQSSAQRHGLRGKHRPLTFPSSSPSSVLCPHISVWSWCWSSVAVKGRLWRGSKWPISRICLITHSPMPLVHQVPLLILKFFSGKIKPQVLYMSEFFHVMCSQLDTFGTSLFRCVPYYSVVWWCQNKVSFIERCPSFGGSIFRGFTV